MAETNATTTVNASGTGFKSTVTLTTDAQTAYATGDALTTNQLAVPNVVRSTGGRGVITKMTLTDTSMPSSTAIGMELHLFDRSLSSTYHVANTAAAIAQGDIVNFQGVIPSGPWYSNASTSGSINASTRTYYRSNGTSLVGVPIVRGAPVYISASSLTLTLEGDYID